MPSAEIGTLIAKIGPGTWFAVGASSTFSATTSGTMTLLFNDLAAAYGDNSGSVAVTITIATGGQGPRISGISPSDGPFYGGTSVTITGSGLGGATVTIGGVAAAMVSTSDTRLVLTSPPSPVGPRAIAEWGDLVVRTPSGTATWANAFTYRGVAVIAIRGMESQYPLPSSPPDGFTQSGGIEDYLVHQQWPSNVFMDYSYKSGAVSSSGDWVPNAYTGTDTLLTSIRQDADTLRDQIRAYLAVHPSVDVYVIGHSQGGVIAMSYLADLNARHEDPGQLPNGGRLAALVTLDSPIGGMPFVVGTPDVNDMHAIYQSAKNTMPRGGTASVEALWGLATSPSNQQLAADAVHVDGARILTIGNEKDWAFGGYLDTQWVLSEGNGSGLYARSLDQGATSCPLNDLLGLCNHGIVQKNADVNGSILALFEGQSLPDSSALTMPPDQLAFATGSSSAASGTATAATLGLTASATGIGSVTAGFYVQGGSPVGEPLFRANGIYFDVRVAPGSEFTSLEITDCATSGATGVEWWDTAGQRWTTVSSPTYNASTGCINIIVTASTSPSLNQLSGTVFGLTTTPSGGTATPPPTPTPTPTPTPAPTPTPSPSLSAVGLSDGIAAGVNRGTKGFSISSAVVAPHGYITLLVQTNPNLAGSLVQIWVKSKTSDWHALTTRLVATDGTVHFFARVSGWTGYWVKFPGDTTHTPAASHGRIATTKI